MFCTKKIVCVILVISFLFLILSGCAQTTPLALNSVVDEILCSNNIKSSKITAICKADNYIASLYSKSSATVSEDELQEYVDVLLLSHEKMVEITDRSIVETGDVIVVSYLVYYNSEVVANAESESLIVGSNNYGEDFEKAVVGATVGEPFSFEVNAPVNTEKYKKGDALKYNVLVKSINYFESYTASDQYILDYYGATTEEEFLSLCEESLIKEKELQNAIADDDKFLDKVAEQCKFVIDKQEAVAYSQAQVTQHSDLAYISGLELSEYIEKTLNMTESEFYDYCYDEGVKEIKRYLLVGAVMQDWTFEEDDAFTEFCSMCGYDSNQDDDIQVKYAFLKAHTVISFAHKKTTKVIIHADYDSKKSYTVDVYDTLNTFGGNCLHGKKYAVSDDIKADLAWVLENARFKYSAYSGYSSNHLYDTKIVYKSRDEEIVLMIDSVNNYVKYEFDNKIVCMKLSDYLKELMLQIKQ